MKGGEENDGKHHRVCDCSDPLGDGDREMSVSGIGENIKKQRKKAGITQMELANRIGVPFQSISQWECGKRNPKYNSVVKIAKAIGCNPGEILSQIKTNADHIRAMTDEELAKHICCPYDQCIDLYRPCIDCIRSWLKSPVEVDDG